MEYTQYLSAIGGNVERMAEALDGQGDLEIPSCPGWSAADLLAHMTNVLSQKLPVFRLRLEVPPERGSWLRASSADPNLAATVVRAASEVVAELVALGPAVALWSWYERDQTSRFWARRLAHEAVIHRVDAELAVGLTPACQAPLAADGVGELLEVFLARPGRPLGDGAPAAVVHLHGTDLPCDWSVHLGADEVLVRPGHDGSPAATLSGPVSEIYLWGWGRNALDGISITGDRSLAGRLRALAAQAT